MNSVIKIKIKLYCCEFVKLFQHILIRLGHAYNLLLAFGREGVRSCGTDANSRQSVSELLGVG